MTDGVAQGDGFGPLFFSLELDELLTVREAMRDLTVDSTMLGQEVHVVESAHVPVTDDIPLTLVAAPSYAEISRMTHERTRNAATRSPSWASRRPRVLHCLRGLGGNSAPCRNPPGCLP
jgi:hypothetical protein